MIYEKNYFSARIVNIWNSLSKYVVDVNTVNEFISRAKTSSGCTRMSSTITQPTWPESEMDQYMKHVKCSFVFSCVK